MEPYEVYEAIGRDGNLIRLSYVVSYSDISKTPSSVSIQLSVLPREIRDRIYGFIFPNPPNLIVDFQCSSEIVYDQDDITESQIAFHALDQGIYLETSEYMRKSRVVTLHTGVPEDVKGQQDLMSALVGCRHLDVNAVEPTRINLDYSLPILLRMETLRSIAAHFSDQFVQLRQMRKLLDSVQRWGADGRNRHWVLSIRAAEHGYSLAEYTQKGWQSVLQVLGEPCLFTTTSLSPYGYRHIRAGIYFGCLAGCGKSHGCPFAHDGKRHIYEGNDRGYHYDPSEVQLWLPSGDSKTGFSQDQGDDVGNTERQALEFFKLLVKRKI